LYINHFFIIKGMVSTIQLASTSGSDYGTGIKVAPMTDEVVTNAKTCFWVNGTKAAPLDIQPAVPDTTSFSVIQFNNFIQLWNVESQIIISL